MKLSNQSNDYREMKEHFQERRKECVLVRFVHKVMSQNNSHFPLSSEQLQHVGMPFQTLMFEPEASDHLAPTNRVKQN